MNMSLNGQNYCLPCIINHTYLKVFTALHLTITIIMINISVTGHMWVCSLDKFILTLYDRPSPSNLPLTVKAGRNACRYLLICTQSTLRTLWLQPVSPFCLPSTQTQKIYVSLSPSLWNLLLTRSMLQKTHIEFHVPPESSGGRIWKYFALRHILKCRCDLLC